MTPGEKFIKEKPLLSGVFHIILIILLFLGVGFILHKIDHQHKSAGEMRGRLNSIHH